MSEIIALQTNYPDEIITLDKTDEELVKGIYWGVVKARTNKYACRYYRDQGKIKQVFMHREIMKAEEGQIIDHINGNGLDNRRCNLRFCTNSENLMNARTPSNNKSGTRGVFYKQGKNGRKSYWVCQIKVMGKSHCRYFSSKSEAINYRKSAIVKYHGEFASLER